MHVYCLALKRWKEFMHVEFKWVSFVILWNFKNQRISSPETIQSQISFQTKSHPRIFRKIPSKDTNFPTFPFVNVPSQKIPTPTPTTHKFPKRNVPQRKLFGGNISTHCREGLLGEPFSFHQRQAIYANRHFYAMSFVCVWLFVSKIAQFSILVSFGRKI